MFETIVRYLEQIAHSDALEILVAVAVIAIWWFVSKTRRTLRTLRGEPPVPAETRPRRRLPLY